MVMDAMVRGAIEDRNRAAVDRLEALGARLSDEEHTRRIDPPVDRGGALRPHGVLGPLRSRPVAARREHGESYTSSFR
jgi:hypothetical protein